MLLYHPYKSDKPGKKYYIITNSGKKVYFGAAGYSDFTHHRDEQRKQRYIDRHKSNETWTKGLHLPELAAVGMLGFAR
jgi:hypothetical protein